jgi:hypothetical protein
MRKHVVKEFKLEPGHLPDRRLISSYRRLLKGASLLAKLDSEN